MPKATRVRLVRDPSLDDHDRYGRLLRYVLVDDTDVNLELVRRGAASPYFFRKSAASTPPSSFGPRRGAVWHVGLLGRVPARRAEHGPRR